MKILDIIDNLDKSEANQADIHHSDLFKFCDIHLKHGSSVSLDTYEKDIKAYWIAKYYDNDGGVGVMAFYLHNVFMGIYENTDELTPSIQIVTKERYYTLKNYLQSITIDPAETYIPVIDLEGDWGDSYVIFNSNNLLNHKKVIYNDEVFEVAKEQPYNGWGDPMVNLIKADGKVKTVPADFIKIPYHLDSNTDFRE